MHHGERLSLAVESIMRFTEGNEYQIVFEYTLQLFGYQNKTNSAS